MRNILKLVYPLLLLAAVVPLQAQQWVALGPFGGDVRSLAYDPIRPERIFLGTSGGGLYVSNDGGATWSRRAQLGDDGYVLDNIVVDPYIAGTMYVAAWRLEGGGDLFRSRDSGTTWTPLTPLHGKSIRALALAPSQPRIIFAGALDGVFRSNDSGDTWQRISPAGDAELKNIEALAVDPVRPDVIYAGTWHLPWKTSDGGRTWRPIRTGVIDDSDVFSITVDRRDPKVVYASACTGIYRSDNAGELFRRVHGIPNSARRTRSLEQDPSNPEIVYAGTTRGLWKTDDGGRTWLRMTGSNVVVNDIVIDPQRPARVLLATDRGGVLASDDGGLTFRPSNDGFTHRQITAVIADRDNGTVIYASTINDRNFGGVFVSREEGAHWSQLNAGLTTHDVYALHQAADGTLLAGTARGVFALAPSESQWRPLTLVLQPQNVLTERGVRREWVSAELTARVAQLEVLPDRWLAASTAGLFTSLDNGQSWHGGPLLREANLIGVAAVDPVVVAAAPRRVMISRDRGVTWRRAVLPKIVDSVYGVAVTPAARLWIMTGRGAFTSTDAGRTWEHVIAGVPARNLRAVTCDAEGRRLLAASMNTGEIFESRDDGRTWTRLADIGQRVRSLVAVHGRVLAATVFNGIVSSASAGHPAVSSGTGPTSEHYRSRRTARNVFSPECPLAGQKIHPVPPLILVSR